MTAPREDLDRLAALLPELGELLGRLVALLPATPPVDPEPAPAAAAAADPAPAQPATTGGDGGQVSRTPDLADLQQSFRQVLNLPEGKTKVKTLLADLGAGRLSDIPTDRRVEAILKAETLLGEQGAA